jgi:response regulator RpfG family c-di-GMP phosphodiesterase
MVSTCYKTCLLIDDNFIDNFVTRKILETGHFAQSIVICQSATEAIDLLKAKRVAPHVIFLDVRMPMMDGFEFLVEYDKVEIPNKKSVKIFMLSSSLDPIDVRMSTENKYITQFIHKPLTHKFLETICQ